MPSREYPDLPMLGVSVVVKRRHEVLLVKRGREPLKDLWAFPGGLVETGETTAQAARREVLEETGLELDEVAFVDLEEAISYDDEGRVLTHFVLAVYEAEYQSGVPMAGDDAAEVRWVERDNPDRLELTDGTRQRLNEGQET